VGASLLAMAVCQPLMIWLGRRHREQARSHRFLWGATDPLWEPACWRWRCVSRWYFDWAGAIASRLAPTGFCVGPQIHCRSQPAGDGGVSVTDALTGLAPSRASSLPQVLVVGHRSTVGASLLAMAVCQPLMIWLGWRHREQARSHRFLWWATDPLWEPACWRWRCVSRWCFDWAGAIASKLAPTGFCGGPQTHCGSQPAGDSGMSVADALAGPAPSRAGSLPQVFVVGHRSTVGASLLAMAVCQPLMLW